MVRALITWWSVPTKCGTIPDHKALRFWDGRTPRNIPPQQRAQWQHAAAAHGTRTRHSTSPNPDTTNRKNGSVQHTSYQMSWTELFVENAVRGS